MNKKEEIQAFPLQCMVT